ncbi:MAG: FecR domain-containing protein [Burkholderiales bacterium]|nr:FecR domain-containing protein [Burkholderiales bacterium]
MKKSIWIVSAALLATLSSIAPAAPKDVVVEALNAPAWVTRSGTKQPLAVGTALRDSDEISTAEGSRVLLRLGDGSTVKLGEQARFVVANAGRNAQDGNLFKATLDVLAGAFRFTTSALAKARVQRDVTVRLPTITAGIRGTDFWGKSEPDRDFVVLIEGSVAVQRGSEGSVTMESARSLFAAPRGQPTPPLSTVPEDLLGKYAAETELTDGAARAGGRWKVTLSVTEDQTQALAVYDKLRAAGYAAVIAPRTVDGKTTYRVRLINLATEEDAFKLALRLKLRLGFTEAAVST